LIFYFEIDIFKNKIIHLVSDRITNEKRYSCLIEFEMAENELKSSSSYPLDPIVTANVYYIELTDEAETIDNDRNLYSESTNQGTDDYSLYTGVHYTNATCDVSKEDTPVYEEISPEHQSHTEYQLLNLATPTVFN